MKKVFVSLSFILAVGLTTAIAGDKTEVNGKITQSFEKEFTGAEFVTWTNVNGYKMARFVFHDHATIAYFNEDGELLGSARNVLFDQLPLPVIKLFEKDFAGADFTDISEISNDDGTFYVIKVDTKNRQYHVKVNAYGNILNYTRIK